MPDQRESLNSTKYKKKFKKKSKRRKEAFKLAHEIRRFEIELYWKRAAYFWTLIAASLLAYGTIKASDSGDNENLLVLITCLGLLVSFAWFLANKGSKFWQENWENHVDLLENKEVGPLYKVVLSRTDNKKLTRKFFDLITGPAQFSVSKINQITSFYICLLWLFMLSYELWPKSENEDFSIYQF